jgi:hypothetical protein
MLTIEQRTQEILNSSNLALISPESSIRTREENDQAIKLMQDLLDLAKIEYIPAIGISKQWGEEKSFLLRNIEEDKAKALANLFDQEALIHKGKSTQWNMLTPRGSYLQHFTQAQITNQADNLTMLDNGVSFTLV